MTTALYPTMLSFQRGIEPTEAVLYGLTPEGDKHMVEVVETGVRGQTSHAKANNEKAGATKAGKSNPQMIEIARLPAGCDRLVIEGAIRIMPNALRPSATSSLEAREAFAELAGKYAALDGYTTLSQRYLENLANGRFVWRNTTLTDKSSVSVTMGDITVTFDPAQLEAGEILGIDAVKEAVTSGNPDAVDTLVKMIAGGLSDRPVNLWYSWTGEDMLPNCEVFPSQDYDRAESESDASRMLSWIRVPGGENGYRKQATMHSQKIGAAVRAIDDWHGDILFGALPVNPYAGHQETGHPVRHKNKAAPSYFDLAKKPELFLADMEKGVLNDNAHFFMACLVRGGVYGGKEE